MKKDDLKTLVTKIRGARNIAIFGHKNPDGDSLCSTLALAHLIKINFNKKAVCLYDGNIPDMLDNVPLRKEIQYWEKADFSKPFDLCFMIDYGTKDHIGGNIKAVDNAKFIIEIDHHKNDFCIGNLCLNDYKSSSVGEMLFQIASKLNLTRDNIVNELIAISILTDTGFFRYVNNGIPLSIMAKLVKEGVDIDDISDLLNNKPRKTVITEAAVTARAKFFYNGKLALAEITSDDYKNIDGRGDTVLSLLGQIKGVEYVALLKSQKTNQTGVSLRSKNKPIDDIAVALGGGGHTYAAGAVVKDSLEHTREKVLELFRGIK